MKAQTVMVLDAASPVVSLAIARRGKVLASAELELRRTSERLLSTVETLLIDADCQLGDLAVAALQGPGSFTGLRIGLATVLGWQQALGIEATAIPTLPVLALAGLEAQSSPSGEIVAAVNAMRGDWVVQRFSVSPDDGTFPQPRNEARLLPFAEFDSLGAVPIVGFELPDASDESKSAELDLLAATPLAPTAARVLSLSTDADLWQASRLIQPIYFRPPAVTLPKRRNR